MKRRNIYGLIIVLLGAISQQACYSERELSDESGPVTELSFQLAYDAEDITCTGAFTHAQQRWEIQRLAFFVSELQVQSSDSQAWQPVSLSPSAWQTDDVSLIWFSDKCEQATDSVSNTLLSLAISPEKFSEVTALRFSLAVPNHLNHLDPLRQPSPLNLPDMFWSWRMGYKFIRFDIKSTDPQAAIKQWSYHLGSLGCESPSVVRAPTQECTYPNRYSITLPVADVQQGLVVDLAQLLSGVSPAASDSCMFKSKGEESCERLAENLKTQNVISWQQND